MKLSLEEMDFLGLDDERRYVMDDSRDAELIRQRQEREEGRRPGQGWRAVLQ